MYAIIDIEASGGTPENTSIIELAIFRFDGTEIIDQLISLVSTEKEIDWYVQKLTGITNKMIKRAPKFHELAKRVIEITDGCILVGHGIHFDYKILRKEFRHLGYIYEKITLDTLSMAKELTPNEPSYSLGKLCHSLGIPLTDRHRAAGDARATVDLLQLLINKDKDKTIIKKHCIETEVEKNQRLNFLVKNLPNCMGIVHFLDKKKNLLYSCVANDIAMESNRLLFQTDTIINEKIKTKIFFIEYEKTHNEIIALLKFQCEEIKINKNKEITRCVEGLYDFGVYRDKNRLTIEKINKRKPIAVFNDFSKANEFVAQINQSNSTQKGLNKLYASENSLIIGKNAIGKEKFFVCIKKNRIFGFGFFTLNNQINDSEKLDKITIKVVHNPFIYSIIINYLFTARFEKVIPHEF